MLEPNPNPLPAPPGVSIADWPQGWTQRPAEFAAGPAATPAAAPPVERPEPAAPSDPGLDWWAARQAAIAGRSS